MPDGPDPQEVEAVADAVAQTVTAQGLFITLLVALAIVAVGVVAARLSTRWAEGALRRAGVERTQRRYMGRVLSIAVLVLAVTLALAFMGVPAASLVAIVGVAGIAVGLALQDTLANAASGVIVIVLQPYRVGEFVEVAGVSGWVTEVAFFHTQLRTRANTVVYVPNSDVMDGNVTNYSRTGLYRLDLTFGISYGDDVATAKRVLEEIVEAHPSIAKDPPATVAVRRLGDSSVDLVVRPYVSIDDELAVEFDVTEQVRLRFPDAGLTIPFPQRDVHLRKDGTSS